MSQLKASTILIIIGSHLATAPRVQKEAKALRDAGAKVIVCGTWWSPALADEDAQLARSLDIDFRPVVDVRNGRSFRIRVLQRLARELFCRFNWTSPRSFGLGTPELLQAALRIKANLTIVHSEAGLWIAKKLQEKGHKVGVDFEDWFSQDLPEADRKNRPVAALQALERYLLSHAGYCTTTTRAMAVAMAMDAKTDRQPVAIPNCFPAEDREQARQGTRDPIPENGVSFHWFSQTIGPGRGLESVAKALPLLKGDWQLSLRGDLRHYGNWFSAVFPSELSSRISLLPTVPNDELLARTMSHGVGLALEIPYCPSRDLTATNKIFEYLRAGLAIIATRTRGQVEVMQQCPDAGIVVDPKNTLDLVAAMQAYIDDSERLKLARKASEDAGGTVWAWECHRKLLVDTIASCVTSNQEMKQ